MIAAASVAKDPEKYGSNDIEYQESLCYDKVTVPEVTDLGLIAKACEISLEEIKDLNPELLRGCTPPGVSNHGVGSPAGRGNFSRVTLKTSSLVTGFSSRPMW